MTRGGDDPLPWPGGGIWYRFVGGLDCVKS